MANHYTALAHAYATTKASSQKHTQVLSIAPPTECSLAVTLPSAQLLHKGGATTHPKGSIRNVKGHPGSSDPPSRWRTSRDGTELAEDQQDHGQDSQNIQLVFHFQAGCSGWSF